MSGTHLQAGGGGTPRRKSSRAAAAVRASSMDHSSNSSINPGSLVSELSDGFSAAATTTGSDVPPALEITHEEFLQNFSTAAAVTASTHAPTASLLSRRGGASTTKGGVRRLRLLGKNSGGTNTTTTNTTHGGIHSCNANDDGSAGSGGNTSSANYTIGSYETVKMSNSSAPINQPPLQPETSASKKQRWQSKLKRMIGVVKPSADTAPHFPDAAALRRSSGGASLHFDSRATAATTTGFSGTAAAEPRPRAHTDDSSTSLFARGRRVRSSPGTSNGGNHQHHHKFAHRSSTATAAAGTTGATGEGGFYNFNYSNNDKSNSNAMDAPARRRQNMVDDSIRGRFDGIDVLYLGGAQFVVPAVGAEAGSAGTDAPWDAPFLHTTFTGHAPHWLPSRIVTEMMWSSSSTGSDVPEILLDGIYPGADHRWSVRVEETPPPPPAPKNRLDARNGSSNNSNNSAHQLKRATSGRWWTFEAPPPSLEQSAGSYDTSDDGSSPTISSPRLRSLLWGPDPAPADVLDGSARSDDNPMHQLAARCSIPIDIDDDSFLISTREHIQAIHDIVSLSLTRGEFDVAFRVLQTLLHSLEHVTDTDLRFVKGATLHNMGVLQLWNEAQHHMSVTTFQRAVDERSKHLPLNHPDIAVSLLRQANASFATGNIDETATALEKVLAMLPADHLVRAKVLNNLAVAYYFQRDRNSALNAFASALEIQKKWLAAGTVRRETTVYDATVTLCNMGKVYMEQSDFDLSFNLYEEALLLLTTIFRKDHDMVLTCLASLAMAKACKGEPQNAIPILQGCLRSQNSRFGVLSPASMETAGLSSCLYARVGDYDNAVKSLLVVRKWQKANLADRHPALIKSKEIIKALEAKLGRNKDAFGTKVWV